MPLLFQDCCFSPVPEFTYNELEMFINAVQALEAAQINGHSAIDITIRKITEIQEKMQADMIGAVEGNGLAVERFNIIMSQIQFNTSLQERIKAMLN